MKRDIRSWLAPMILAALLVPLALTSACGCSSKNETVNVPANQPPQDSAPTGNGATGSSLSEAALASALQEGKPVLLNFHSTQCAPCIEIEKVIKGIEPEFAGRVKFIVVDVYDPDELNLCDEYGIQTIPTTVFLDAQGKIVEGYTGVIDAPSMREILNRLIEVSG